MATQGNYYLNAATFASATAVYTDAALTTLAPNGYYSVGGVVRQQVGGVLQAQTTCPSCGTPATLCFSATLLDACCGCATP